MVHYSSILGKGSYAVPRVLALLSLMLFAFPVLAQDASSPYSVPGQEEEGLSRTEIISYIAMCVGFVVIIAFAWVLNNKANSRKKTAVPASKTPGLRISSAHSHDPYMRRKVIKKTS